MGADPWPGEVKPGEDALHKVFGKVRIAGGQQGGGTDQAGTSTQDVSPEFQVPVRLNQSGSNFIPLLRAGCA